MMYCTATSQGQDDRRWLPWLAYTTSWRGEREDQPKLSPAGIEDKFSQHV